MTRCSPTQWVEQEERGGARFLPLLYSERLNDAMRWSVRKSWESYLAKDAAIITQSVSVSVGRRGVGGSVVILCSDGVCMLACLCLSRSRSRSRSRPIPYSGNITGRFLDFEIYTTHGKLYICPWKKKWWNYSGGKIVFFY